MSLRGRCSDIRIRLTAAQRDRASWVIEVLPDFWKEQVDEGAVSDVPNLPHLENDYLIFIRPLSSEVLSDFLYRLEVLAQDQARDRYSDGEQAVPMDNAAFALARKIREATNYRGTAT